MSYDQSIREGLNAEQKFILALNARKLFTRPATKKEQFQHIDVFWIKEGTVYSADVKAMKRQNRSGEVDSKLTWVEFVNVQGKPGWLYGKANMIAFELENSFMIMDRLHVAEAALQHVDTTKFSPTPSVGLSYRRESRPKEHTGLMRTADLLKYPHQLIKKA